MIDNYLKYMADNSARQEAKIDKMQKYIERNLSFMGYVFKTCLRSLYFISRILYRKLNIPTPEFEEIGNNVNKLCTRLFSEVFDKCDNESLEENIEFLKNDEN